ncbi:MAG TPA: TonB family protein [Allosphingosinicella sp.]|jgi:protein TonB|nr:TonB family protein [Allosphingosinicella sp.]
MTEGAFTQQKKASPAAVAIVVLMHGAALTALMLAKGEAIREAMPVIDVFNVKPDEPPPPEPVKPIEKSVVAPPESVVTHVPPVVETLPREALTEIKPLPPVELTVVPTPPREIVIPKADPPAPPVPEARTVEPARARANLASYVSDEDYPSSAVRNEEQGTTRFRLSVGPDGKVKECSVTGSSGSSALDSTTCRLMKQRARFTPARNNRGDPTGDTVASAVRWVLPTD